MSHNACVRPETGAREQAQSTFDPDQLTAGSYCKKSAFHLYQEELSHFRGEAASARTGDLECKGGGTSTGAVRAVMMPQTKPASAARSSS